MSDQHCEQEQHAAASRDSSMPVRYPVDHVAGVLETEDQLCAALPALVATGFQQSDIQVSTGPAAADRLDAATGRTGLTGLVTRLAERLGIENSEMSLKSRYEDAMRDGAFMLLISAPTDDRRDSAVRILREQGAHTVTSMGRLTFTVHVPPKPA